MQPSFHLLSKMAILVFAGISCTAYAGAFDLSDQSISNLFVEGNLAEINITHIMPKRDTNNTFRTNGITSTSEGGESGRFTNKMTNLASDLKFKIYDKADCLLGLRHPWGTSTTQGNKWVGRYHATHTLLKTDSYEVTCGYKIPLGQGNDYARLIAGLRLEEFNATLENMIAAPIWSRGAITQISPSTDAKASVTGSSQKWGWRAGLAYERPETAMRFSLVYHSKTKHNLKGTQTVTPPISTNPIITNVSAEAELPQAVDLYIQSGVAPGWAVLGLVRWVDWSSINNLDVIKTDCVASNRDSCFTRTKIGFRDGWTYGLGVVHKPIVDLRLTGLVTYDKDTLTDTTRGPRSSITSSWALTLDSQYEINKNYYVGLAMQYKRLSAGKIVNYAGSSDPNVPTSQQVVNAYHQQLNTSFGSDNVFTIRARMGWKF